MHPRLRTIDCYAAACHRRKISRCSALVNWIEKSCCRHVASGSVHLCVCVCLLVQLVFGCVCNEEPEATCWIAYMCTGILNQYLILRGTAALVPVYDYVVGRRHASPRPAPAS